MTVLITIAAILCSITITQNFLLLALWQPPTKNKQVNQINPSVSVLLAARNEEANITRCIQALLSLEYPSDRLEILVGDDQSTDKTAEVVKRMALNEPRLLYFLIEENLGQARGKANVLAQLAKKAKGQVFFITDADIAVPPTWINSMLNGWQPGVGMAIGFTVISGDSLQARMQRMDWTFALGMIKTTTDLGMPLTGMGNNMWVTSDAYRATGGYENFPFNIVEDFELFRQVQKHGFTLKHLAEPGVLAWSAPVQGFMELLQQRKRWMRGAVQMPRVALFGLLIQALFFPAFIFLLFSYPFIAVAIWVTKVSSQSLFIKKVMNRIGTRAVFGDFLFYEIYSTILSLAVMVFYILPGKVTWKGRKY